MAFCEKRRALMLVGYAGRPWFCMLGLNGYAGRPGFMFHVVCVAQGVNAKAVTQGGRGTFTCISRGYNCEVRRA